jgi:REP-associated tyrosine transposase
MIKGRPPRLDLVYTGSPIFFVTFCTRNRRSLGLLDLVQDVFETYASKGFANFNVAVGRYVIMPDHIHLFVRGDDTFELSPWV